jgi:hypothetical protein
MGEYRQETKRLLSVGRNCLWSDWKSQSVISLWRCERRSYSHSFSSVYGRLHTVQVTLPIACTIPAQYQIKLEVISGLELSGSNLGWDIRFLNRSFLQFLNANNGILFRLDQTASFQILSNSSVFLPSELSSLHLKPSLNKRHFCLASLHVSTPLCQSQSYFTAGGLPLISLSWWQLLETHDQQFFFQLNTSCYSPYVTSSLTRGWICLLQLLLAFASAVILRSDSRGSHDHILLSPIPDSRTYTARTPYLYRPGTGWFRFTPRYGFHFHRLLRLSWLRLRYLTTPPHGATAAWWWAPNVYSWKEKF